MANGINKVILIGNLGRDPEVQTFENGVKKANLSLATTETFTNREGNKEQRTEWHRVVLWRRLAEIAEEYLHKGNQIYIEGRLRTRKWDDKDGNARYTTEVEGQSMTMLGGRPSENNSVTAPVDKEVVKEDIDTDKETPEDDLPF